MSLSSNPRATFFRGFASASALYLWAFLLAAVPGVSWAKIGVQYQMALGNPSSAVTDAAARTNYLISRDQYALSYNDDTHQPNWVSWSFTSADNGSSGRTDAWAVETELPTGYLRIGTSSFGTGWDRGHMCPSADRTSSVTDNEYTFRMSNIVPQASANNQGLWQIFESYCRSMADDGSEILITSGPTSFTGNTISNGMMIPGAVWKVAVKVPAGTGTAASRVTTGCRVIAIVTPNVSTGLGSWQSYITSVEQVETYTGLHFFGNVDPSVATYLKNVVDTGSGPNNPTVISSFSPASGGVGATVTISGYNFGSSPVVSFNGITAEATVTGGNTIQAIVPSGAQTGNITVTGTGGTDTSNSTFEIVNGTSPVLALSIPGIGGLSANEGSAGPSHGYLLEGANLTGSVTVTAPSGFEVSPDGSSFSSAFTFTPAAGTPLSQPLYVRLSASASRGLHTGTVTHTGGGATVRSLIVTGRVDSVTPALALSQTSLQGFAALTGSSGLVKSYTLSGYPLSGAITATASSGFEISTDNLTYSTAVTVAPSAGRLADVPLYVRLKSTQTAGTVTGGITHSGGGASSQYLALSGSVVAAGVNVVPLLAWEFTGLSNFGSSPLAATTTNASATTTGLVRGPGLTVAGSAGSDAWGANGFTSALADAISDGDQVEFDVSSPTGAWMTFTQIPAYNVRRSSTGPTTGQWQYRVGTGAFHNIGSPITWGSVTTSAGNLQSAIDLSSISDLALVPPGTTTTFRLINYGATSSNGNFYFNNISGNDLGVSGKISGSSTPTPVISGTSTLAATCMSTLTYQITASLSPTSYAAAGLPDGVSLNATTGLISGTPLIPGSYPVVLTASNANGDGTFNLLIVVDENTAAPQLVDASSTGGRLRAAFEHQIQALNSPTAYLASNLPPGLTLDPQTGLISGTPTAAGTYLVEITLQNSYGEDQGLLSISVVNPLVEISATGLAEFTAELNSPSATQSYSVSGSNLTGPITVSAPDGYEIRTGGGAYSSQITLTPVSGSLSSVAVQVRLSSSNPVGTYTGSIIHTGGGAIPQYLELSGSVLSPYAFVMSQHYGLTGADADPAADPDGDGYTNEQEYAFGLDPTAPGGSLTQQTTENGQLVVRYLQRTGVDYVVDTSVDLQQWTSGVYTASASSTQPSGLPSGCVQYEVHLPMTENRLFMRIRSSDP
jgi:DNA/RNA endonuclease G (NUC1)